MNIRKVGGVIIMKPNHNNYGTALQGFAKILIIQSLGYSFRVIRYNKKRSLIEMIRTLPGYIKSGAIKQWLESKKRQRAKKQHPEYAQNVAIRTEKCNAFKSKYFEPLLHNHY